MGAMKAGAAPTGGSRCSHPPSALLQKARALLQNVHAAAGFCSGHGGGAQVVGAGAFVGGRSWTHMRL
jgi:hypothetical protein